MHPRKTEETRSWEMLQRETLPGETLRWETLPWEMLVREMLLREMARREMLVRMARQRTRPRMLRRTHPRRPTRLPSTPQPTLHGSAV
jgi:hypothetical protein